MTIPSLDVVNGAIELIHPGVRLAVWHSRLYITNGIVGYEAREDASAGYFQNRIIPNSFGTGGTRERALVHIVLWAKDKRRYGMYAWQHWASKTVKGVEVSLPDYLEANGYADPAKVGCIFCGKSEGIFDWFHQPVRFDKAGQLIAIPDLPQSAWRSAITGPGHFVRWCETLGARPIEEKALVTV